LKHRDVDHTEKKFIPAVANESFPGLNLHQAVLIKLVEMYDTRQDTPITSWYFTPARDDQIVADARLPFSKNVQEALIEHKNDFSNIANASFIEKMAAEIETMRNW
jgi:hypothetical protein